MKTSRTLLTLCALCAALFISTEISAAGSSARLLIAYPPDAANRESFMKGARACESFTREYFAGSAETVTVTLKTASRDEIFRAAAEKDARWALAFSSDDGDCVFRAYDCSSGSILLYENESAYKVDLDRKGAIDMWTGKNLYALLFQHLLDANGFFLKADGSGADVKLVLGNFVSDDASRAAFPEISRTIAEAVTAGNSGIRILSKQNAPFPADFYRFIPYADEIRPHSRSWNARWYLGGTLFEDKGSYKIFLILIDCETGSASIIGESVFFGQKELQSFVAQAAGKVNILIAGGSSGTSLENRSLAMLYEYTRGGQFPAYSFAPAPDGGLYLSMLTSVLRFTPDGALASEVGAFGTGPGEFQSVYKVRTDAQGNVYCLDYTTGKVLKYGRDGALKNEIRTGAGYPMTLAVSEDGTIAVSETGKNRLVLLAEPYLEPKQVTAAALSSVAGLYYHRGSFYAWGTEGGAGIRTVEVKTDGSTAKGAFLSVPNFYIGQLTRDAGGNYYALEQTAGYLLKADANGTVLWLNRTISGMTGSFSTPNDLTVASDGTILIADMMNRRGVALKEVKGFSPLAGADAHLSRAKADAGKKSALYMADLQCAAKGGSGEAMERLAEIYASMNCFDAALALLEKRLHSSSSKDALSKKIDDLRFRSYLFAGNLLAAKIDRLLGTAGVESARPAYTEAVKSYELALKIRPEDRELQKRYASLKSVFERASGEAAPQIEITGITAVPVFAALYKFYAENEIGSVTLKNGSGATLDSVFARIELKGYMDYPTESRTWRGIADGAEQKLRLFAVFNNNILNITEDTPLSAQVSVIYRIGGKEYSVSKSVPLNVYNRNALIWDDASKLSSFVTPKDPVVSVFSRGVLNRFRNSRFSFMNSNMLSAMQIFDSLGVYGITYVKDPKTPFAVFSKSRTQVDFIQYPRDTLRFKTGDCDDLTVLTSSLLENVGIECATVTVPGHIFLLFNTGVPESNAAEISQNGNLVVRRSGTVWIPVETTMLGKPFLRAWEEAAKTYARYAGTADIAVNSVHEGWEKYAPVTLNETQWAPAMPDAEMSEKVYFEDMNSLIERELQRKVQALNDMIRREPGNPAPNNSLGVVYARYGKYEDAEKCFRKAAEIKPDYPQSWQNLGNIYLLLEKLPQAEEYYRKASALSPKNANLYINLAVLYDRMNRKKDLEKAYALAISLDSRLEKQYAYLLRKSDGEKAAGEEKLNVLWGD